MYENKAWVPQNEAVFDRALGAVPELIGHVVGSVDSGFDHGYGDARDALGVDTQARSYYGTQYGYNKKDKKKRKENMDFLDKTLGRVGYAVGRTYGAISGGADKGLGDRRKNRGMDPHKKGPLGYDIGYHDKDNKDDNNEIKNDKHYQKLKKGKKAHNESAWLHPKAWEIPLVEGYGCDCCDCDGDNEGITFGVPKSNANSIAALPINQFGDTMNRFLGDGDDPETYNVNKPALLAASITNTIPDPKVVKNGINKFDKADRFKLIKFNRDDEGQNG